jgi:hypothetical protein
MITRVFGKPNSGKSLYSLKRLLEYECDICVISLEVSEKMIQKRIETYIENYYIDNDFQISKETFSNIIVKSFPNVKLNNLFDFFLKIKKEKGIKTFLIDSFYMIDYHNQNMNQFPALANIYQNLYRFSKDNNIDLILTDSERGFGETWIKDFFNSSKNLENIKIEKNSKPGEFKLLDQSENLILEDSVMCFFKKPLNEVRDKKIDFILK